MEKTFLLYLSVQWGDLIKQIKKKSVIYTLSQLIFETKLGSCNTLNKCGQKYFEGFVCMMMRFKRTSSRLIIHPQTSRVDLFCQWVINRL